MRKHDRDDGERMCEGCKGREKITHTHINYNLYQLYNDIY